MKKPKPPRMKTAKPKPSLETALTADKPAATVAETKQSFNLLRFFAEVRQEGRKVVWPSRKETWITTVMVLIMVVIAGLFLFLVDGALGLLVNSLLKSLV